MRTKALFKTFENADSETINVLSGYIGMENDAVKKRIFRKSMEKYLQRTSDSESLGKNYACISHITEVKRTGRALRIALSATAAACAVAIGIWVVRPLLKQPETVNNGYSVNYETTKRELWTAVPPDQATKEDIFWLMMNSIFYYDKVSGKITWSANTDEEHIIMMTDIDFQCSLSEDKGYVKTHEEKMDTIKAFDSSRHWDDAFVDMGTKICYYDGNRVIKQDNDSKETDTTINSDHKSIFDIEPVPNSERLKYEDDEKNIISYDSYYPDPTPEMGLCVLFPQEFAAYNMFDMDKWEKLSKNETINGRGCYHLVLPNVQETDIERYEIWVDVKTGVLMKMSTIDSNKNIVGGLEITEIHYEDEAEPVTPMPDDIKAEKDAFDDLTGSDDIDVLTRNIAQMQEQLSELDAKIEKLKDPNNTVLSEEEKQASLAELEEKRNTVQLAINELNAKLIEDIEKHNTELNENYNEQLKRLNELKKQYGNKTAENTAPRKLEKAVSPEKATKKDVYHLLLNSIYYYDKVSGTVYFPCGNNFDVVSKIEFQTVLSASKAYEHYTSYDIDDINTSDMADIKEISKISTHNVDDREMFCNLKNNVYISLNNISKEYENDNVGDITTMENVEKVEDDERITVAGDGYPCYSYTTDPTNIFEASSECLFAQGLTMGFLQDFNRWDIKGTAKYEDKECFCISGTASKDYGDKHNVVTFDLWVDAKTGVLLQYAGYDENGNICDYVYTENIAYEDSALDVKDFSKSFIEGYKMI